jgi:hypothetical protein
MIMVRISRHIVYKRKKIRSQIHINRHYATIYVKTLFLFHNMFRPYIELKNMEVEAITYNKYKL